LHKLFASELARSTKTFFGKYWLKQHLGFGKKTEVFRAELAYAPDCVREVALKRIRSDFLGHKDHEQAFIQQTSQYAKLHHDNIAQVYELGTISNVPYIAREYVPGQNIKSLLERSQKRALPLPLEATLHIERKLLLALDYAHNIHLPNCSDIAIHTALSGTNILIEYAGDVKLTDFGTAKVLGSKNYIYSSPEQRAGNPPDLYSDLYAAGAILYHMLTGEVGFAKMCASDIRRHIASQKHLTFVLNTKFCNALGAFVARALAITPKKRFSSAANMLHSLENLCQRANIDPNELALRNYLQEIFLPEIKKDLGIK
jgi:serine/threonine-protein kinase